MLKNHLVLPFDKFIRFADFSIYLFFFFLKFEMIFFSSAFGLAIKGTLSEENCRQRVKKVPNAFESQAQPSLA